MFLFSLSLSISGFFFSLSHIFSQSLSLSLYVYVCVHMCIHVCLYIIYVRSWCDGSSDRSFMLDPLASSHFSQYPMTGVTKAVVCVIMSVGGCI